MNVLGYMNVDTLLFDILGGVGVDIVLVDCLGGIGADTSGCFKWCGC